MMLKVLSVILTCICSYCICRLYLNIKALEDKNKELQDIIVSLNEEIDSLNYNKAKERLEDEEK